MPRTRLGILAAAAVLALAAAAEWTPACASDALRLSVRVYDAAGSSGDLPAALSGAEAILRDAGVTVEWVVCDADVRCRAPLRDRDIALRLLRGHGDCTPLVPLTLGYSVVDVSVRSSTLATVHVDCAEQLARTAAAASTRVLAPAIAHELVHVILGSNEHARAGLMRAVWTTREVVHDWPGDWRLAPAQATALRAALGPPAPRRGRSASAHRRPRSDAQEGSRIGPGAAASVGGTRPTGPVTRRD